MKVIWEDEAFSDLKDAIAFISITSPQNAEMVLDGLLELSETLAFFPLKYPIEPFYNKEDVRVVTRFNHKLVYQIQEEVIIVLRVFPAKQNPENIIRKSK